MDFLLKGIARGFIWALLALGVYLSYRILDFADLSCEGTFTLGASVSAALITSGMNPMLTLVISFLAGTLAGVTTGFLHTKLKIPPILAGILTMTALFSVNLLVMGSANIQLSTVKTIYDILPKLVGLNKTSFSLILGGLVCIVLMALLYWFFGTEIGAGIRATGINEKMCRAQGIDTDITKIIGLALSNGLIALSGAFLCQYQGYSNVTMGVGAIVIGLASIIVGEAIFSKFKNFYLVLASVTVGSVIYQILVSLVQYVDMPTELVKLMTAMVVVVAICASNFGNKFKKKSNDTKTKEKAKENITNG